MKIKMKIVILFAIIISSLKLNAQEIITNEQKEFVNIIKTVLNNKEVKNLLKEKKLINNNTIYILNRKTPLEDIIYSEQIKGGRTLTFTTAEELFFRGYIFIEVDEYTLTNRKADLTLYFDRVKMSFSLEKSKSWKLKKVTAY